MSTALPRTFTISGDCVPPGPDASSTAVRTPYTGASTWRVRSFSACSMSALKDCSTVSPASRSDARPRVSCVSSVPESETGRKRAPAATGG